MKKLLWFLIGMAIILSIPVLLFTRTAPPTKTASKHPSSKAPEVRRHQIPNTLPGNNTIISSNEFIDKKNEKNQFNKGD